MTKCDAQKLKHMTRIIQLFTLIFLSAAIYGQGTLVWDFTSGAGVYSSPVVDDSVLYIGSNDSCLYALDKLNGSLKWKFKTRGEIKSRPLLYNNSVIFNSTDGRVYAVNKHNAQEQWQFVTNGEKRLDMWDYYLSSPVCSNGKVFVGSGDGHVYALDPNNGQLIWKFQTGDIVHATPLVHNNKVFVGSYSGFFYALNAEKGDLLWRFRTVGDAYFPKGEIQKGACIYNNSVIFGSRDYNVYALNTETGRGLWNMKEKGSWVIAEPLVVDDLVFFGTSDSHRFCGLSAKNGYEKYSFPLNMRVYGEAVLHGDAVYFGCFNGKLYQFNRVNECLEEVFQTHGSKTNYNKVYNENDEFKAGFELYGNDLEESENKIMNLGAILSTPVIDKGIIYFADANGVVYAFKL